MNLDDFLCEMSKKHRNMYKKIIKSRNDQNISFRKEYDIRKNLHKLYPLYINVNKRAKEFKSPPIPSSFFTGLERKFGHNCFCIIMSVGNKDIGFVLIIQGTDIIIPFLMGIDYKYRELHVWHNLTIECVRYAIETRITNIDLGLTNFELKKRLGAKKININMFARFKNNVVNRFCKSFLSKLL